MSKKHPTRLTVRDAATLVPTIIGAYELAKIATKSVVLSARAIRIRLK